MGHAEADVLSKAKQELVKMRLDHARDLVGGYERGKTERSIEEIVKLQAAIEALDRAINEERIGSSV
jgi:hypothetical protein